VDSENRWVYAKDLRPGYRLETADHRPVTVVGTRFWTQRQSVYNLTVDGLHTFYVGIGASYALVHNAPPCLVHDVLMPDGTQGIPGARCTCPRRLGSPEEEVDPNELAGEITQTRAHNEAPYKALDKTLHAHDPATAVVLGGAMIVAGIRIGVRAMWRRLLP
jgi:hypothetical protein